MNEKSNKTKEIVIGILLLLMFAVIAITTLTNLDESDIVPDPEISIERNNL